MRNRFAFLILAACSLTVASCVTTTEYSAKGNPVRTEKRPDSGFWKGAAGIAVAVARPIVIPAK